MFTLRDSGGLDFAKFSLSVPAFSKSSLSEYLLLWFMFWNVCDKFDVLWECVWSLLFRPCRLADDCWYRLSDRLFIVPLRPFFDLSLIYASFVWPPDLCWLSVSELYLGIPYWLFRRLIYWWWDGTRSCMFWFYWEPSPLLSSLNYILSCSWSLQSDFRSLTRSRSSWLRCWIWLKQ